eukprot:10258175-Heterocapsa_arctica.AAC.1
MALWVRISNASRGLSASRSRHPFAASAAVAGEEPAVGAERPRWWRRCRRAGGGGRGARRGPSGGKPSVRLPKPKWLQGRQDSIC